MKEFYDSLRASLGPLKQNQVDGIEVLLQATDSLPLAHRAYVLGTAWHETGPASSELHMTPRREIWGPTEAQRNYEGRADLGNTLRGDGKRFMGRGYVQITGRANYYKASKVVGADLVGNSDLALEPKIAAKIIVDGMKNGWFTGKKMADYATYKGMRRVVNGTDRADLVASYAEAFEKALKAIHRRPVEPVQPPPAPVEPPAPEAPAAPPAAAETPAQSLARWVILAAGGLVAALAAWIMKG